jgi:type III secretion protein V
MNRIIKNKILEHKELVIVILILMVLLMMIVPLPTIVMDSIIALNIGITVLILMVVIYMKSPLSLSSFPSILLILALLRIGITVSTSRLILLDGNAGEIINTFGEFVVGGNLVVGIIIFIIITLVNFIVITKGSERVAEVAARFSLDAMPGKQMSIDSDLRAGNITMEVAAEKRNNLGLENKLYGAMDGAMKFVKGDAIASIIDIIINLCGGLTVGMLQKGMGFSDAISHYSILTVGDGLVQQIPALLISLTAGMMITRVSDERETRNMGQNILSQVFNDHKAMFAASTLLIILALIPGMPSPVFIGLLFIFVTIGFLLRKRFIKQHRAEKIDPKTDSIVEDIASNEHRPLDFESLELSPLMLYVAPSLKNTSHLKHVKSVLTNTQQQVMMELGVIIPQIIIRYNPNLVDNDFQLLVNEIPSSHGTFHWDKILLLDNNPDYANVLNMDKALENKTNFGQREQGVWINSSNEASCKEFGLHYINTNTFLTLYFKNSLRQFVGEFFSIQEVKSMLDKMTNYQDLIRELLRLLTLNKITEILQRLVAEDISIRNLKTILSVMLDWAQREKDVVLLCEYIRKGMGRFIAHKFSSGNYVIPTIILSPDLEDTIRNSIRYTSSGNYLAVDPEVNLQIIQQIEELNKQNVLLKNIAIVTQMDIRRYIRSITEKNFAYLPVLSFQELEGFCEFSNIGVIEYD